MMCPKMKSQNARHPKTQTMLTIANSKMSSRIALYAIVARYCKQMMEHAK